MIGGNKSKDSLTFTPPHTADGRNPIPNHRLDVKKTLVKIYGDQLPTSLNWWVCRISEPSTVSKKIGMNLEINYQPQLVSRISSINSIKKKQNKPIRPESSEWTAEPPWNWGRVPLQGQAAGVACAVSLQQNTVVCLGGRGRFFIFLNLFVVIYVKFGATKRNPTFGLMGGL